MAKMQQQVVYWGQNALEIASKLPGYADFYQVDHDVTPSKVLSDTYRNALFLLGSDAAVWQEPAWFAKLPANAILYDSRSSLSAAIQALATLKNAQPLDFSDLDRLAHVIHYDYFPGQWAFKLAYDTLRIAPDFQGEVSENAGTSTVIQGDFGGQWTPLATWVQMTWSYGDWYETFYPECTADADVDVRFLVRIVEIESGRLIASKILAANQSKAGLPFYVGKKSANIMVSVQAKGNGTITLGRMHINRSRESYGHLFVGGRLISDPHELAQGVASYFDAGDMKPPLMVYFSGYHIAESFEGNFLMRAFHTPFLLISDNRLVGGAFYFGSDDLERQIADVIQDTLNRLRFRPKDLILVGQSMGSTGALYYGAQLTPAGIVVSKPLPDVGTIANEGRLNRPNDFEPIMDIVNKLAGGDSPQEIAGLNERFWTQFKKGDLARTILGIVYMQQDDYQPDGFARIYHDLANQNAHVQLLHKGIPGRHTDPAPNVIQWVIKIARLILAESFKRKGAND